MTFPTKEEEEAINCLRVGQILVNPKYLPQESNPYEKLKERCRKCYAMRAHFPPWVRDLMAEWEKEKGNAA